MLRPEIQASEVADAVVASAPGWALPTSTRSSADPTLGVVSRAVGQIPICWGPDAEEATRVAHEQFRWFAGGWKVNADLPTPAGFSGATQFVRPEEVAESIPCGPDLDAIVEAVAPYWEAGFTDVALVQVGDASQERFLTEIAGPLLDRLPAASS